MTETPVVGSLLNFEYPRSSLNGDFKIVVKNEYSSKDDMDHLK